MHVDFLEDDLPSCAGAYILQIHVLKRQFVLIKALGEMVFEPARYIYCGSAKGPGGIRARVRRHIRRDKKAHWHVDRLTIENGVESLMVFTDQSECDLIATARDILDCEIVYKGFGSSDCERCETHLLKLPVGTTIEDLGFDLRVFHPRT